METLKNRAFLRSRRMRRLGRVVFIRPLWEDEDVVDTVLAVPATREETRIAEATRALARALARASK
jgi:hypothetical protein